MEFFNYFIKNITNEVVGDRITFVTADFDMPGGWEKGKRCAFLSSIWPRIKANGYCDEREIIPPEDGH